MYIYTTKTQLRYKKAFFWGFSNIPSDFFYNIKSPLFYVCTALFVNPLFRYVRNILGVADHNFYTQIQIFGCICIFNIAISLGISLLLKNLDKKYNFTEKIIVSKSFQIFIFTGLYIENFLRSPQYCFIFGVFFCLYLILLFWVLFFSYSFSFIEMPFFFIGVRLFAYIFCIFISVYIKLRSSLISHASLNLKNNEKISKMSVYRCLEFYRQQSKMTSIPFFKDAKNENTVYTNCTLILKKKGINSYIEGLYNFRPHLIKFILGFIYTLFSYICICYFESSIDGTLGMRSVVNRRLKMAIDFEQKKMERPPLHLYELAHIQMLGECKSVEDYLIVREGLKDPSFKKEEIENRIKPILEKEKFDSIKAISIYKNVEKDLSEKSLFSFLNPYLYIKLKKLCHFCQNHSPLESFSMGVKQLWNS